MQNIYKRFLLGTSCLFLLTMAMINISENSLFSLHNSGQVKGVFEDLSQKKITNVSPLEAQNLIQEKKLDRDFYILDVRSENERKDGFVKNSINLDVDSPKFAAELDNLDKNKSYLVYCRIGFRSKKASEIMQQKGFKDIYNLNGGISAWDYEGLEVEKLN